MKTLLLFLFLIAVSNICISQTLSVSGNVVDDNLIPMPFVNVLLFTEDSVKPIYGKSTDTNGEFNFLNLNEGNYTIKFSFIGFQEAVESFNLSENLNFGNISLLSNTEDLEEALISIQRPKLVITNGMLVFNVENSSLSVGNTYDLLKKTPGVLVFNDAITVKNRPTTIFINGKRTYLSDSEIATFLKNLDATIVKSVEVITSPSAKYDAEAGTVLNIVTTKAMSLGYKANFNSTYEQAIFPKYQFGTSHFYKNKWLNVYGSYNFNPRKENKEDENFIRYFEPDRSVNSIWTGDFRRVTRSRAHQANIFADIVLSEKSTLSISSNIALTPYKKFKNNQQTNFLNPQEQLDSTRITTSNLNADHNNLSFNGQYSLKIKENGSKIIVEATYINYTNDQNQDLNSEYFLPNGEFLQDVRFFTDSFQNTQIFTTNLDSEHKILEGDLQLGIKYSNIHTDSGISFFNTKNDNQLYIPELSDDFNYTELIYASYFNFERSWEKFGLNLGLRGELTNVYGQSLTNGQVSDEEYFKLFPTTKLSYQLNAKNGFGLAYKRSLQRPRYESLNPYRYFVNENNFSIGNPNLRPAIDNKFTASYNFDNKLFIELIYQQQKDGIEVLAYQDNEIKALRYEAINVENYENYSFDIMYASSINDWFYLSLLTSTYYLKNEYLAAESEEITAKNSTFGIYGQLYGGLTLSKKQSLSADITAVYYSNLIAGSFDYNNLFNFSISFRKSLWNDRASVNMGVDDIFNTSNVTLTSKYLNQDNSYLAVSESRIFRAGFKYNIGNFRLHDNRKSINSDERERIGN